MREEWLRTPTTPTCIAAGQFALAEGPTVLLATHCTLELRMVDTNRPADVLPEPWHTAEYPAPVIHVARLPAAGGDVADRAFVITADGRFAVVGYEQVNGHWRQAVHHSGSLLDDIEPPPTVADMRSCVRCSPSVAGLPPSHPCSHCVALVWYASRIHFVWLSRTGAVRVTCEAVKLETHPLSERNQVFSVQLTPELCPINATPLTAVLYYHYGLHYDFPLVNLALVAPRMQVSVRGALQGIEEGPWAVDNLPPTTRLVVAVPAPVQNGGPASGGPPPPGAGTALLAFSDASVSCFSGEGVLASAPLAYPVSCVLPLRAHKASPTPPVVAVSSTGELSLLILTFGTQSVDARRKGSPGYQLAHTPLSRQPTGPSCLPAEGAVSIQLVDGLPPGNNDAVHLLLHYPSAILLTSLDFRTNSYAILGRHPVPAALPISGMDLAWQRPPLPPSGSTEQTATHSHPEGVLYSLGPTPGHVTRFTLRRSITRDVESPTSFPPTAKLFVADCHVFVSHSGTTACFELPSLAPTSLPALETGCESLFIGDIGSGGNAGIVQVTAQRVALLHRHRGLLVSVPLDAAAAAAAAQDGLLAVQLATGIEVYRVAAVPATATRLHRLPATVGAGPCAVAWEAGDGASATVAVVAEGRPETVALYGVGGGGDLEQAAVVTAPSAVYSLALLCHRPPGGLPTLRLFCGLASGVVWVAAVGQLAGGGLGPTPDAAVAVRVGTGVVRCTLQARSAGPVVSCVSDGDGGLVWASLGADAADGGYAWQRLAVGEGHRACQLGSGADPSGRDVAAYLYPAEENAGPGCRLACGEVSSAAATVGDAIPLPDPEYRPVFVSCDAALQAVVLLLSQPGMALQAESEAPLTDSSTSGCSMMGKIAVLPVDACAAQPPVVTSAPLPDTMFTALAVAPAGPEGSSVLCVGQCHPNFPLGYLGVWQLRRDLSPYAEMPFILQPIATLHTGEQTPTCACMVSEWALLCAGVEVNILCWHLEKGELPTPLCPDEDSPATFQRLADLRVEAAGAVEQAAAGGCFHTLQVLEGPAEGDDRCHLLCSLLYQSVSVVQLSRMRDGGVRQYVLRTVSHETQPLTLLDHVAKPRPGKGGHVVCAVDATGAVFWLRLRKVTDMAAAQQAAPAQHLFGMEQAAKESTPPTGGGWIIQAADTGSLPPGMVATGIAAAIVGFNSQRCNSVVVATTATGGILALYATDVPP
eukprot:EG_transcript_1007